MSACRLSYILALKPRQILRIARGVAAAGLVASLSGCAGLGLPFGTETAALDTTPTGSIRPTMVSANVVDGVAPSDWTTILNTVAASPADKSLDSLAWRNQQTGSAGTISGLTAAFSKGDVQCRSFATTVSDQRGIRRYRGEACRSGGDHWQLYGMVADDAQLS